MKLYTQRGVFTAEIELMLEHSQGLENELLPIVIKAWNKRLLADWEASSKLYKFFHVEPKKYGSRAYLMTDSQKDSWFFDIENVIGRTVPNSRNFQVVAGCKLNEFMIKLLNLSETLTGDAIALSHEELEKLNTILEFINDTELHETIRGLK